ncbi:MAG TPA: hypothetical protein VK326_11155 [Solirubrobacterales bacterium]|nr:hypothetical protein [Solirubrobacterales bacterium]
MPQRRIANDPRPGANVDAASFGSPERTAVRDRTGLLHVCPCCDCELVYPTEWAPAARNRWAVELRCPDCEWRGGGEYAQEVVDRLDEVLDDGTERLLGDLSLLAKANREEQVERFVRALRDGHVLPEDF